ncbi:MAG: hypothetical protein NTV51_14595 [Verrucomicrobia bacterium]|nr:hypothetical protein [Verrucomicrobiota bacterium]
MEEQYVEFEGQRYETFWEHLEGQIFATHFSYFPEKPAINVEATFFTDSVPTGFVRYAQYGLLAEIYEYEDGLLMRAHQATREHDPRSKKHGFTTSRFDFEYAGEQISKIRHVWESGTVEVVFP